MEAYNTRPLYHRGNVKSILENFAIGGRVKHAYSTTHIRKESMPSAKQASIVKNGSNEAKPVTPTSTSHFKGSTCASLAR